MKKNISYSLSRGRPEGIVSVELFLIGSNDAAISS